ncbi:hypothetical protein [uncultured Marivita sp.]|uniref:hypothetical protein n=1 Tax=uncultured Marivita sp. TaxID=888080 RepID=UPI00262DFB46|nr:hypothetical protein [uncultured Marivita sp.]
MFEPSPILFAFIFVQRFVYFEVLGGLAILRLIVGRGWARVPAAITLMICLLVVAATFAPALGLQGHPIYRQAVPIITHQGGAAVPFVTSCVFASSFLFPDRRWRWIDWAHLVGVAGFLAFWIATKF